MSLPFSRCGQGPVTYIQVILAFSFFFTQNCSMQRQAGRCRPRMRTLHSVHGRSTRGSPRRAEEPQATLTPQVRLLRILIFIPTIKRAVLWVSPAWTQASSCHGLRPWALPATPPPVLDSSTLGVGPTSPHPTGPLVTAGRNPMMIVTTKT